MLLVPNACWPIDFIDETSLHNDLYTFLTNKDGHGRQGTLMVGPLESIGV